MQQVDGKAYRYGGNDTEFVETICVGWLDDSSKFEIGPVDIDLVAKLAKVINGSPTFSTLTNMYRAKYWYCPICGQLGNILRVNGKRVRVPIAEVWLPTDEESYFVTPTGILHFLFVHRFQPPEQFRSAVMKADISTQFSAEQVVLELRKKYAPAEFNYVPSGMSQKESLAALLKDLEADTD